MYKGRRFTPPSRVGRYGEDLELPLVRSGGQVPNQVRVAWPLSVHASKFPKNGMTGRLDPIPIKPWDPAPAVPTLVQSHCEQGSRDG